MLVQHRASMGYTMAFWRIIRDAQPLYERGEWHSALQREARAAYPEALRANIVATNFPFLRDHVFSFRNQTAKAIQRGDPVTVNRRTADWLASYFDILFAVNRVLHPGEKRQMEFVERECRIAPRNWQEGVRELLEPKTRSDVQTLGAMDAMSGEVRRMLIAERLSGQTC